jgi:hypothetical protein
MARWSARCSMTHPAAGTTTPTSLAWTPTIRTVIVFFFFAAKIATANWSH